MNSCAVLAGKSGRTRSTLAIDVMIITGSNCAGSKFIFLYSSGLTVSGAGCAASKVYPSGSDVKTVSAPILPAAPARFSTMTGCPSFWCRPSATIRVTVSTPPPAGTQTMILIGLFGKLAAGSCASAVDARKTIAEIETNSARTRSPPLRLFLCDARQLLRRQFQIEQPYGIAAQDAALCLLVQERKIVDCRRQVKIPVRIIR